MPILALIYTSSYKVYVYIKIIVLHQKQRVGRYLLILAEASFIEMIILSFHKKKLIKL